jgi:hypothetical protein
LLDKNSIGFEYSFFSGFIFLVFFFFFFICHAKFVYHEISRNSSIFRINSSNQHYQYVESYDEEKKIRFYFCSFV